MTDLRFLDPPIEVAAASPRLEMIISRLRSSGLRPYAAAEPIDFSVADTLLVDVSSASRAVLERCARAAMIDAQRQIVLLDIEGEATFSDDTLVLKRDRDLTLLRSRLAAIARRTSRLSEAGIRRETALALGARLPAPSLDAAPMLLYIGDGSPLFLALQGALTQRGIAIVSALSRHTAQEYALDSRFSGALLDVEACDRGAGGFADWIIAEHGLGGLPIFALAPADMRHTERQNALIGLCTDVIACDGRTSQVATMVETLARRSLAQAPFTPKPALNSVICDLTTGLFSRRFFEAHLSRQMTVSQARGETLSLLTLKLDGPRAALRETQRLFADMIRPLLRETDCPAILSPAQFAVSMPSTTYRGGAHLSERIAETAARTKDLADVRLLWRIVEKRAYHTPQTFLGACLTGPYMRGVQAA